MGVLAGKRPLVKADVVAVKEVVRDLGRLVKGFAGVFGITGNVNAPEDNLTFSRNIEECTVFDRKAEHLSGWGRRGNKSVVGEDLEGGIGRQPSNT